MPAPRVIPTADDVIELATLNREIKFRTTKLDNLKKFFRAYAIRQGEDLILAAADDKRKYSVTVETRNTLDESKIRAEFPEDEYPDLYKSAVNTNAFRVFITTEGLLAEDYERPQENRYVTIKEQSK